MYLISQSVNPINWLLEIVFIEVPNARTATSGLELCNSYYCGGLLHTAPPYDIRLTRLMRHDVRRRHHVPGHSSLRWKIDA